jgi:hypothetical protein
MSIVSGKIYYTIIVFLYDILYTFKGTVSDKKGDVRRLLFFEN